MGKVAAALEQKPMPPAKMPQPSDGKRARRSPGFGPSWTNIRRSMPAIRARDGAAATSGEYTYSIRDLTGLDLKFDRDFASDSVGGEGFTNFGDVQFMEDANLERYLEAAKRVANHAVIGSGPLAVLRTSRQERLRNVGRSIGFRRSTAPTDSAQLRVKAESPTDSTGTERRSTPLGGIDIARRWGSRK